MDVCFYNCERLLWSCLNVAEGSESGDSGFSGLGQKRSFTSLTTSWCTPDNCYAATAQVYSLLVSEGEFQLQVDHGLAGG
jgi:hypothetical protein